MKSAKRLWLFAGALSLMLVSAPTASGQFYGPYYGPYYGDDYWYTYDFDRYGYDGDYRERDPGLGVDEVLNDPEAEWDYEPLSNEWEIESVYGEVEYEPEGDLRGATRQQVREAIRAELQSAGSWEWEALQGEWENESIAGSEVEFDPTPNDWGR